MINFNITDKETQLLIIDIQDRLAAAMQPSTKDMVIKNTSILLDVCRVCEMPVVVSEQYPRGLGSTVPELKDKISPAMVIEKLYFNCMKEKPLEDAISACGRKTVIVTGMEAHICVLQTVISLQEKGYQTVLASDAVSSRNSLCWKQACEIAGKTGALVYPTETIAFMILEKAGTPRFKEISPLFR